MRALEAISRRRSIRRFRDQPVPADAVERILEAATQAPSAGNLQPWRFVVLQDARKDGLVDLLRRDVADRTARGEDIGSANWSADALGAAPVAILVFDGSDTLESRSGWGSSLLHAQAIGAAIQNMLLAATDLGLGSLWITDVLFVAEQVRQWLDRTDPLVAAVAVGYAAEQPPARPRRPWREVTEGWKDAE